MKSKRQITVLLLISLAGLGMTGCDQENKTALPTPAATEMKSDAAVTPPATGTDPATAKPKDHPAH